jgi:hypothetical protein
MIDWEFLIYLALYILWYIINLWKIINTFRKTIKIYSLVNFLILNLTILILYISELI